MNVDMVETRGYTLEEIALAFDGPNASLATVPYVPEDPHADDETLKARDEEAK